MRAGKIEDRHPAAGIRERGVRPVKEILSLCGNRCDLCPAYNENIRSDADRKRISEGWLKYYGFQMPPEEIACVGCQNEGKHASPGCGVRPCAREKGVE